MTIRLTAAILFFSASFLSASDWPQWRGPTGMGVAEDKDLPLTWGGKDNVNVLWKVALPKTDQSQSSPVVSNDRIFVTTAVNVPLEQHVTCYKKSDGSRLWETTVPNGPWIMKDLRGGYTCSTPATDGERVFALFGSSKLAALNNEGHIVWQHDIEPRNFDVAISSSPILYKDNVILLCDQNNKTAFMVAYNRKSGEKAWEMKRPEAGFNHSTPMIATVGGKPQMLVAASEALQGVDPENGKVLWFAKCKGDIATPVTDGKLVYVDNARGGVGCCVDATGSGDVTATNVKWTYKTMVDGFNSGIIADGRLYRLFKQLKCIDLATGQEIYSETLGPGTPHASPILTPDGRIYYASAGTSYVIKTGPKFELLAKNELGDNSSASAAISDGLIILKGAKNLFCVGKK
ncbi:MAG TPA: PQQ-binding-like beta-propeller repeat protein [Planctomycetota bacterium]|nr:PQQ-binding-like beta-propeller repeat protein [Planctomycetota bacterium]